jgi:hypothetical protein
MTMKIQKEVKLFLIDPFATLKVCFQLGYFHKKRRFWTDKLAIEIPSRKTSSIVANNHTIRVHHWNNFK